MDLIESVSISIGGDPEKKWYCEECNSSHGSVSHPKVCGITTQEYNEMESFKLVAKAFKHWHDGERDLQTIEEYRNLQYENPDFFDRLLEEEGISLVYDDVSCASTKFEFEAKEGHVIDQFYRENLDLWENLASRKPESGKRTLDRMEGRNDYYVPLPVALNPDANLDDRQLWRALTKK